ncbi:MAG: hypothetical protein ACJ8C4_06630 [Gemmataceae bacterium]
MTKTRRWKPEENGVTEPAVEVSSDVPSDGDVANEEKQRRPVHVISYLVARDAFIQASIWKRIVQLQDGNEFTAHDVSLRKRYKDSNGEWQSCYSFRGSELYAVAHAVERANAWILEERALRDCPF